MDGNGPSPAELGLTQKDLGIKTEVKKAVPTTEQPKNTEVSPNLEEAHKKILRIGDPIVEQLHEQWLEPRGPIAFRYETDSNMVTLMGTVHQYNPENPMIQEVKSQVENYLQVSPKEKQLVMVEGFHGGAIPDWNSLEEAIEASGETGAAAFLAKQSGGEVTSPEVPNEQVIARLKELGFTADKIALRDILKSLPTSMRTGRFNEQNLASIIYGASIQAQTGWVEAIPPELLITQYDQRDNTDKPYGVIVYPHSDWNGAFLQNEDPLRWFFADVREKYNLRVLEAESKYDIARGLLGLKRRYGQQNKISFALLGGHGTKNSILFGGEDERHRLVSQDLQGSGVRRTSEFFEPHPTIVLVSCSTGTQEGIGQQLSEMMGAKVIAPEIPTNIKSIRARTDQEGKLLINVEYQNEGAERLYVAGVPEQQTEQI